MAVFNDQSGRRAVDIFAVDVDVGEDSIACASFSVQYLPSKMGLADFFVQRPNSRGYNLSSNDILSVTLQK